MKRTLHRLRRRGPVDRRVSVRPQHPWYLKLGAVVILVGLGYGIAYWQYTMAHAPGSPLSNAFQAQIAMSERQLQIERATRSNAIKEMALLQDEIMQLKEDVAFYKGILSERGGSTRPQLQGVKISRTSNPSEFHYEINLTQANPQGKSIQGGLFLTLQGEQEGKSVSRPIVLEGGVASMMVNFKKFRRVEGVFSIPQNLAAKSLLVEFVEAGTNSPRLTQTISLSE